MCQLSTRISSESGRLAKREFGTLISFRFTTENNVPPSAAGVPTFQFLHRIVTAAEKWDLQFSQKANMTEIIINEKPVLNRLLRRNYLVRRGERK